MELVSSSNPTSLMAHGEANVAAEAEDVPSVVDETAAQVAASTMPPPSVKGTSSETLVEEVEAVVVAVVLQALAAAVNRHDSNLLNLSRVVHHLLESRELLCHLLELSRQILIFCHVLLILRRLPLWR